MTPNTPAPCHLHLFGPAEGCPTCARYVAAHSPGEGPDLFDTLDPEQHDAQLIDRAARRIIGSLSAAERDSLLRAAIESDVRAILRERFAIDPPGVTS